MVLGMEAMANYFLGDFDSERHKIIPLNIGRFWKEMVSWASEQAMRGLDLLLAALQLQS